jgi:surface antigen
MPATNAKTESDTFSAEERAAMKKRAAELRAEGKKGAKKADGLQAVLDSIAEMAPEDRALAERVHVTVTAAAPELSPKTWYGMPAYANADGKVVVFFQDAGKFNYRYSTLVSRTRRTSTTATCGRCRTRSRNGAPWWRRRSLS